jgi:hypothetical protein
MLRIRRHRPSDDRCAFLPFFGFDMSRRFFASNYLIKVCSKMILIHFREEEHIKR